MAERHIYKLRTFRCGTCGQQQTDLRWSYDAPPTCENGHPPKSMDEGADVRGRSAAVHPDSIPGGEMVEHAICNVDGSPRRFDSRKDIRETARQAGWTIMGETPKSRHTRWV